MGWDEGQTPGGPSGPIDIADVTGLQGALDGKADTSHTHAIAAVTGLQGALDGKADTSHTHAIAAVTGLQGALDGKADTSHAHDAGAITSGRLARARMPSDLNSNLSAHLVGARPRKLRSLSLSSGENELGSPPSGKRWLVQGAHGINPTGGSITLTAKIKHDGVYWPGFAGNAISAGSVGVVLASVVNLPVLDSVDTLSIHASGAGASVVVFVLEFDEASPLKSAKLWSLSTNWNTLYTCPEGYRALTIGSRASGTIPYALSPYETLLYRNDSGGTRTYSWALVDNGDTPDAPGPGSNSLMGASGTLSTGNIINLGQSFHPLEAGDSLQIHVDDGAGPQAAWTNLLEVLL